MSNNIIKMANDIATFHTSFLESESTIMVAEHINKFWAPTLRTKLFEHMNTEKDQFHPLIVLCLPLIRCEKYNPVTVTFIDKGGTGG